MKKEQETTKSPNAKVKAKGKTVSGKPANVIDFSPTTHDQLSEQSRGAVVFAFGRFNPPTIGHEKLVNKVKEVAKRTGATAAVFLSHTQDKKTNPLSYQDKVRYAREAFGPVVVSSPAKHVMDILGSLQHIAKDVTMVVGSDRVQEFTTLLNKYIKDYNIDSINVVSAGERDPDAEGVAGVSGTKLRAFAVKGDLASFTGGLPDKLKPDAAKLLKQVRSALTEETIDEALSVEQRRKRAMIMRRLEPKIKRARERAQSRLADSSHIRGRAAKKARNLIRRRLAGGKNYADMTPAEKVQIDNRMKSRATAIVKLTNRLINRTRQAEFERLQSYIHGHALAALHTGTKTPVSEELDNRFEKHMTYNVVDLDSIVESMVMAALPVLMTEKEQVSLRNKSNKSNFEYSILEQVYMRGMLDTCGNRSAAFDRVNSFISGGRTAMNEDRDLFELGTLSLDDMFAERFG
jgi:phosphopantetheine adenylyltransferase